MAYLRAGATSYVTSVHYDVVPIPYLYHYLSFFAHRKECVFIKGK